MKRRHVFIIQDHDCECVMRSEEEVRAKKAELLSLVIEKHNKIDHDFGRDDTTAEIDGKIYALEYVLGERRDI